MKKYFIIYIALVLTSCCPRPSIQVNKNIKRQNELSKEKSYRNITSALNNPKKVIVLDLSGQQLSKIPNEIEKLTNLVFLDIGDRAKNLLFNHPRIRFNYCRVGGGLRHYDRMTGKYYNHNFIKELPESLFNLSNLKLIRISGNMTLSQEMITRLKTKGLKYYKNYYQHPIYNMLCC